MNQHSRLASTRIGCRHAPSGCKIAFQKNIQIIDGAANTTFSVFQATDEEFAGKKITGRKRHILTDTDGRLLTIRVHGADVQDRDGGKLPLKASRQRFPFVARVFADGGYAGRLVHWAADKTHVTLEIIRRGAHAKGFEVLPRRWVVERTFAWIFKNRRLVRDYELLTAVAETLITIAASATLLRRWT